MFLSCESVYALHLPVLLDCSTHDTAKNQVLKWYFAQLLRAHSRSGPETSGEKGLNPHGWAQCSCLPFGHLKGGQHSSSCY